MSKPHQLHTARNSILKALIVYDNFAFAAKANAILHRAAYQVDTITHWNIRPWRVDVLRLPPGADEALVDAADVHLIVFAGPHAQSLPSWLEDWLERWVARRQFPDAALTVVGGIRGDSLTMPASPELLRFAHEHGLGFIADDHLPNEGQAAFPVRSIPVREAPSVALQPPVIPNRIPHDSCRHWGINE